VALSAVLKWNILTLEKGKKWGEESILRQGAQNLSVLSPKRRLFGGCYFSISSRCLWMTRGAAAWTGRSGASGSLQGMTGDEENFNLQKKDLP
jgi:hypothetical protein